MGVHRDQSVKRDVRINRSWRPGLDDVEQRVLVALAAREAGSGRGEHRSRLAYMRIVGCGGLEVAGPGWSREGGVAPGYQGVCERDVMAARDLHAGPHKQLIHAGGRRPDPAGASTPLAVAHGRGKVVDRDSIARRIAVLVDFAQQARVPGTGHDSNPHGLILPGASDTG